MCRFWTVPNGIYIKRFSTITIILSPICKPAQQSARIPLQEALHYACITRHITRSIVI